MAFLIDGNIILVGDGDFSFSVALTKHPHFQAHNMTSSSLETEASIAVHVQAAQNMALLKNIGVSVFLETDARELHTHVAISSKKYERILFNFPLADRHNIKKNRALLADFFLSCSQILSPEGQVMVTLCKGQGGTPADQPVRNWHDSWQIVAMATNAGFLLTSVMPFDAKLFPEYHSVGFRFQDKSFNTMRAITHVFKMAELVKDTEAGVRGTVAYEDDVYSCSSYVASKMKRDLLLEPNNPTAIVKSHLETSFNTAFKSTTCQPSPSSPILLPGFRSLAYVVSEDQLDDESSGCGQEDNTEQDRKLEKERKNQETLEKLKTTSFGHGVENSATGVGMVKGNPQMDQLFLPMDNENVYVLIRTPSQRGICDPVADCSLENETERDHCEASVVDDEGRGSPFSLGGSETCGTRNEVDRSSQVFHHRVSLLENIPELCDELIKKNSQEPSKNDPQSNQCEVVSNGTRSHENSLYSSECSSQLISDAQNSSCEHVLLLKCVNFTWCQMISGQSMLPGPICHDFVPTRQEMLIAHIIQEPRACNNTQLSSSHSGPSKLDIDNLGLQIFNNISMHIISVLQKSTLLSNTFCSISLQSCDSMKIVVQGLDQSVIKKHIILQSQCSDVSKVKKPVTIGRIVHAVKGDIDFHITLLDITDLTCQVWGIDDKRLLWGTQDMFLAQFPLDKGDYSPSLFKALSLYPMKFSHDISFWESENVEFDVSNFYDVIRNIANDFVVQVSLIDDAYFDPVTNRKSRCYRLHFESQIQALPYLTTWKLQSRIRIEASQTLGIMLR